MSDVVQLNLFYAEWHELNLTEVRAFRVDPKAEDRAIALKFTGWFNAMQITDLSKHIHDVIYAAGENLYYFKKVVFNLPSIDLRLNVVDDKTRFEVARLEQLTVANKDGALTFALDVSLQFSRDAATLLGTLVGDTVSVMFGHIQGNLFKS